MVDRGHDRRPHLMIPGRGSAEPFTSPAAGGSKFRTIPVNRDAHGKALQRQLAAIHAEIERRRATGVPQGVDAPRGFHLEFESPPGFALRLQSLESASTGIELVSTRREHDREFATVFVPQGKLAFFVKRVEKYLTELHKKSGRPKNQDLIESIAEIRVAVAESFWTDAPELLPQRDAIVWWEVWLRGSPDQVLDHFLRVAHAGNIDVAEERQVFPERTVVLARASLQQFAASLPLLDVLAELRRVKQIGGYFMRLDRGEQADWARELLGRLQAPPVAAPAVTILDTGVSRAHPLLAPLLDANDAHAWKPVWGTHDHHGHGTEMAGIGAFGDLTNALLSNQPLVLGHRLESVKIVPPIGANPPRLYGRVTADAAALVEIQAPARRRVFSLAITADALDRGEPTAWSSEIDKLSAAVDGGERRLFFVAAGNMQIGAGLNYPIENYTESVQDPAQAWNALTVGAHTELVELDDPAYRGWSCVAPPGGIGPTSSTSCAWHSDWPIKPDIVMEGGNKAISSGRTQASYVDSLSLLTTYHDHATRLFTSTGETSAATAGAARYAAMISAMYPTMWPETVRALLVDSAEWTEPMRREIAAAQNTRALAFALRSFGFGVPDLERALWSASNSLTLITQDDLQPFTGKRSKDMKLHQLPWPRAELEQLGATEVELRVTLSYFIEPNPARRGWKDRHRYASHGLRFAVQKPAETPEKLRKRINKDARGAEDGKFGAEGDSDGWLLKPNLRAHGSLHHDRWRGTAAELARREHVAVYPVIGWWRERVALRRSESRARYALVVSIRTPPTPVDIYQAVVNRIGVAIPITT